jgi:hypothetical protein
MNQTHHTPPEQLLQYILERGRAGEHVLFDESLIRATFAPEFGLPDHGEDGLVRVKEALETLSHLGTIGGTREFISRLPRGLQEQICFHYFQILEAEASRAPAVLH